jgi:hypothetical protein
MKDYCKNMKVSRKIRREYEKNFLFLKSESSQIKSVVIINSIKISWK